MAKDSISLRSLSKTLNRSLKGCADMAGDKWQDWGRGREDKIMLWSVIEITCTLEIFTGNRM